MTSYTSDLESIVARFESARSSDPNACLSSFAPDPASPYYREIVTELVRVDMELSWSADSSKTLEDYSCIFPQVLADADCRDQIAFEEYRLSVASGASVSPFDFQQKYSINTWHWPVLIDTAHSSRTAGQFGHTADEEPVESAWPTQPDLAGRMVPGQFGSLPTLEGSLQKRLRYISLAIVISLAYLAFLGWNNPVSKVGLFLGSPWLLWINGISLFVCTSICIVLWSAARIPLPSLRVMELVLFGSVAAELACGLASDLFIDGELAQPIAEGDHSLFHYASSWSLPFFALMVGYGILVPSGWRRCTVIVSIIALIPVIISAVAVVSMHSLNFSFFQSFLLQMIIWMAIAACIAIYGVRRLEQNQHRLMRSGKLGKYRLIRQIAVGGMGEVFLAEHALMNRRCAIKLMHPNWLLDRNLLMRFEREVQVLAAISHPNVVQVHDFGFTNEGTFYYVMEYLEGTTLEQRIRNDGPLEPEHVVRLLLQMTAALSVVHQGGIVHRDVKPGNIFLARSSRTEIAKLLDFGLIKSIADLDTDEQITQAGAIIGTPAFMSPEQAAGYSVDHRTDLYSLGVVAYYALTGEQVFVRATAVETLAAHLHTTPPLLKENVAVPEKLQEILSRCLSKDPAARYQSASELSAVLQTIALNGAS